MLDIVYRKLIRILEPARATLENHVKDDKFCSLCHNSPIMHKTSCPVMLIDDALKLLEISLIHE